MESFMALSLIKVPATLAPIVVFLATTGCTSVFETGQLNPTNGLACRSTAGAYYLPKVLVRLSVSRNGSGPGMLEDKTPEFQTVADRRHQPYCLDYLASPTAKDVIAVQVGKEGNPSGLLQNVSSNTEDRSQQIVTNLIQTAENLTVSAFRKQRLGVAAGAPETGDFTFDPFDPQEMTEINRALRRFGFCVYIENHSFSDEFISPQAWCSDPAQERYVNQYNVMLATTPAAPGAVNSGILYRANATHKLVIRQLAIRPKSAPGSREPWALFMTKHVEMPNVSPIFSIGVERALFATRTTDLTFADGVLTDIKITKTSELEGFSVIPLQIAQAIARLPTEIIQLRIDDTRNASSLASAQIQLANALANLAQVSQANPQVPGAGRAMSIADRQGQDMQHCMDQGGLEDFCRNRVIGRQQ
jgi:hypothetical protein